MEGTRSGKPRRKRKDLEPIRQAAVKRVLGGESPERVIRELGFGRGRIYEWLARHRQNSWGGLRNKPIPGRRQRLDEKQIQWIVRTVTLKSPCEIGLSEELWTQDLVRRLIEPRFGIKLSPATMSRLMKRLGWMFPRWRPAADVNASWTRKEFPRIRMQARQQCARVNVFRQTKDRHGLWILSATPLKGVTRFMLVRGEVTASRRVQFMRRLMIGARRRIFLIIEGQHLRRSPEVQTFLEAIRGRLRLFTV